jgi:acetyl esterase/lipase
MSSPIVEENAMRVAFGLVLLGFVMPALAQEQKQVPGLDSVEIVKDVVYGKGGGRDLKLHLIKPKEKSDAPMPVLVWVHGGGWQAGNKDSGIPRSVAFAQRGYFCASIEYRLSQEAVFPAQIEDCKCAIRFLRSKAKEYNIDPERIGVWGASAGGHLVALLGTSAHVKELEGKGGHEQFPSHVNCVCDFCGPTDLIKIMGDSKGASGPVAKLLGGLPSDKKDLAALANPITHVTKKCPPMLLVHGDKDTLVPLDQSKLLEAALKNAGVTVRLFVAENQGHAITGPEVSDVVSAFFDRHLKGK